MPDKNLTDDLWLGVLTYPTASHGGTASRETRKRCGSRSAEGVTIVPGSTQGGTQGKHGGNALHGCSRCASDILLRRVHERVSEVQCAASDTWRLVRATGDARGWGVVRTFKMSSKVSENGSWGSDPCEMGDVRPSRCLSPSSSFQGWPPPSEAALAGEKVLAF